MPDVQDQLRTLHELINDPAVDPQTRQEAQRRWNEIKRQQPGGKMALSQREAADTGEMAIEVELLLEDYGDASTANETAALEEAEALILDLVGTNDLVARSAEVVDMAPESLTYEVVVQGPVEQIDALSAAWNMEDYPNSPDDEMDDDFDEPVDENQFWKEYEWGQERD